MKTTHAPICTISQAVLSLTTVALLLVTAAGAHAQAGGMSGMPMDGSKTTAPKADAASHQAAGVVKTVDAAAGKVTIAHGPVPTLNWPAMTMGFTVKDKALMAQLPAGKSVQVTFRQEGKDYVITSVK